MQTKENFLSKVCEQIKYKPIRNEIIEELENHIEEQKENYILEGMQENEALEIAIDQMGKAEEIGRKLNKIHKPKINWQLLIYVLILLQFGFLVNYVHYTDRWKTNIIIIVLSIIPCILIYLFDYKKLQKYSIYLYIIATLINMYSLWQSTIASVGSRYIRLGMCGIITIPLYIIAFIGLIQNINKNSITKIVLQDREINIKNINILIALSIISILLLLMVTNITYTIMLGLIYLVISTMKIIEFKENKIKKIAILWGTTLLIITLIVTFFIITGMQENQFRIKRLEDLFIASFMPEIDPNGIGWQGMAQKQIINSANLFGKVNNVSKDTILLFNAESSSFPLITILANYGWVIAILMIATVIAFNIKLIIDVGKIKDKYGKMLIIGLSCLFIFRSISCILMNLKLGIMLSFDVPFVSYGKINLITDMISLALIFSIYRRKALYIAETRKEIL